jgi:hypothetical protein
MQLMRSIRESVDLTRLSRIALNNLEKEEGVSDYTAAQPAAAGDDITIDSADAELDFEETQEEGEWCMCLLDWGAGTRKSSVHVKQQGWLLLLCQ